MVHTFKSSTEPVHQYLHGKLIVDIHLIASILERLCYSWFEMPTGPMVHSIIFCFRVVLPRAISFVHLNRLLSRVISLSSLLMYLLDTYRCVQLDDRFWNFNIWDPGMSSTTTTTSTPPTTGTVTTRVKSILTN